MPAVDQSGDVPRLTAGERALLSALMTHPETSAAGLADAARVSMSVTHRTLVRFEALGAAVRVRAPGSGGRRAPDLWHAPGYPAGPTMSDASPVDTDEAWPTARDKVLTALGKRSGLTVEEIAWETALSRVSVIGLLADLEREGQVRRVERRGPGGGRLARGWGLTIEDADESAAEA